MIGMMIMIMMMVMMMMMMKAMMMMMKAMMMMMMTMNAIMMIMKKVHTLWIEAASQMTFHHLAWRCKQKDLFCYRNDTWEQPMSAKTNKNKQINRQTKPNQSKQQTNEQTNQPVSPGTPPKIRRMRCSPSHATTVHENCYLAWEKIQKGRKKVLVVVEVVVAAAAAAAVVVVVVVDVVVVVVVVMMIMIIIVVVVIMKKMMMGAALCFYHKICDSWTACFWTFSTAPSTVHHRFTPLKTWSDPFTSSVQWQTVQLPHCERGMGRRSERLQMYRDIDFCDTNAFPSAFCIRRASDIPTIPLTLPVQEQSQQSMTEATSIVWLDFYVIIDCIISHYRSSFPSNIYSSK